MSLEDYGRDNLWLLKKFRLANNPAKSGVITFFNNLSHRGHSLFLTNRQFMYP